MAFVLKDQVSVTDNLETEGDSDESLSVALLEKGDAAEENQDYSGVVDEIKQKFQKSKDARLSDETRWLLAYRNYRGIYGPEVQFTSTEKSKAFVKITKTKVLAAYGQVTDVLFSSNRFPIGVEATIVPQGIEEAVYFDPQEQEQKTGSSTIARQDILDLVGPLKKSLTRVQEKVKIGEGKTPTAYTFHPADIAAKKMEKKILDQLEESNASKHLRHFASELTLFGHAFMKGPILRTKEYPKWSKDGQYQPVKENVAEIQQVSIWDAYPDSDARNMEESEYFIQRHRLNRSQMRGLKKRPAFREDSIDKAIEYGPNYQREYWESALEDNKATGNEVDRWEVLEYWGYIDKEFAERADIEIPKQFKDRDQIQVNIWICHNQILRFVLNPFTPERIPYYSCPYELNPYSFFGIGVAENMEDTQLLMNGFMRLTVDNAALSSNIIFEIDETNLVPGQNMELYPGKIFRRQGGQPGQAIYDHKIQNTTQESLLVFDKVRQLADEATGIPSFSHGMSGVMSTGRTAAGMSMLMGAADKGTKTVIRNIDDYLLMPLGKALFAFNMQFNFDKDIIGDLEVVALGTESLMRNEIRSQKLLQFMQLTGNPLYTPFVKMDYILRELAASLDLDPEKVVNDPREAGIQAELLKDTQMKMGIDPNKGAPQSGNPAGLTSPSDPTQTGAGTVGPGAAPTPGAQGYTGTGGGSNAQPEGQ